MFSPHSRFGLKNLTWTLIPCILGMFLIGMSYAQSFEGGQASSSVRWFAPSPWLRDVSDSAGFQIHMHLPLTGQRPQALNWEDLHGASERFAPGEPGVHGIPALTVQALLPLTSDGALRICWQPSLELNNSNSWTQAHLQSSDSADNQILNMDAWLNSSSDLNLSWSTFALSYKVRATEKAQVEVGIQRHALRIHGASWSTGDFLLTHQSTASDSTESEFFEQTWKDQNFQSTLKGHYQGSGWSAMMKIFVGPVTWSGQMAAVIPLQGSFQVTQSLPYFMNAMSLNPALSWNSNTQIDSLRAGEIRTDSLFTSEPMRFKIPMTQSLSIQPWPWILAEYTYVRKAYQFEATTDTNWSIASLDFRQSLARQLSTKHLTLIKLTLPHTGLTMGGFFIGNDFEPVLSTSANLQIHPVSLMAQLDVLPWIRLFLGVHYAL